MEVLVIYGAVNVFFACIYKFIGIQYIYGIIPTDPFSDFLQCFFFSNQTFTTVGYGGMHPIGLTTSWVASIEAFIGLMSFALATGTLYSRFSKAKRNIVFSQNLIISKFQEHRALQFMVANKSKDAIMELEATVNIALNDNDNPNLRKFFQLPLELNKIAMFPTSWIINHVLDENSPIQNVSTKDLELREMELFVTLKGYNETFSETVYYRYSYVAKDIINGAKFIRPFFIDPNGKIVLDISKVGSYELIKL